MFSCLYFTSWLDSFYLEYEGPLLEAPLLSLLLLLFFTIGFLSIDPLYCLCNQFSTLLCIQRVNSVVYNIESLAPVFWTYKCRCWTQDSVWLQGYHPVVQNTLKLLFWTHNSKTNPKLKNSFRTCLLFVKDIPGKKQGWNHGESELKGTLGIYLYVCKNIDMCFMDILYLIYLYIYSAPHIIPDPGLNKWLLN